jgi:hypothetical protein
MHGAKLPLPNTASWRGDQLKNKAQGQLYLYRARCFNAIASLSSRALTFHTEYVFKIACCLKEGAEEKIWTYVGGSDRRMTKAVRGSTQKFPD